MFMLTFDTPSNLFQAVGKTEAEARALLADAWAYHARQSGADPDYLEEYAEDIVVLDLRPGVVTRDGEPLPVGDVRMLPLIYRDETRVCVAGLEVPPYEDAVAFVRNTAGEYGIRYWGGHTDWLGQAHEAFGDDEITLHRSER